MVNPVATVKARFHPCDSPAVFHRRHNVRHALACRLRHLPLSIALRKRPPNGRLGRPAAGSVGLTFLLVTMLGYGALRPLTLDATHGLVVLQTQVPCAAAAALA